MKASRIVLLLVTLTSTASTAVDPIADFNTLLTLPMYTDAHIGYSGSTPEHVYAFRRVLARDNAADVFARLLEEATVEGQLYALCGLYFSSPRLFQAVLPRYESMTKEVNTMRGCVRHRAQVSVLVRSSFEPVMTLEPGQTPSEWLKSGNQNAQGGFHVDIAGGGFCHMLRGTRWYE